MKLAGGQVDINAVHQNSAKREPNGQGELGLKTTGFYRENTKQTQTLSLLSRKICQSRRKTAGKTTQVVYWVAHKGDVAFFRKVTQNQKVQDEVY